MADVVDPATRSRMMAGISGKNTQPELLVRKELHRRGLRYVLDGAGLPGRPDLVFPKWKVAVFVHGCFWHWHGCSFSKMPANNRPFWQAKLSTNSSRDTVALLTLVSAGWRVATIWECALRGKDATAKLAFRMDTLASWIQQPSIHPLFELPDFNDRPHEH